MVNQTMQDIPSNNQIQCQQCMAVLPVAQDTQFVTCQFCNTTNFVDKSHVVLHYAAYKTLQEDDALAALRRWMAGNKTVKGLDKNAKIEQVAFEYFPMWMIRARQNGHEPVFLEPAAATSISELKYLTIPAADLQTYNRILDNLAIFPTIPYNTMRQWLADDKGIHGDDIKETSLVHLPIYRFKYKFEGRHYTALVDAATSKVFANIYPSKWEMPYLAIGVFAFVLFFLAALIPIYGYTFQGDEGLIRGVALYCVATVILAVPVFVAAALISAKV